LFVFFIIFFDVFVLVVNNLIFVSKINRNGKNGFSLKYIDMKYIRLLLCIVGIVLLAFLVSLYFFQRNRKLMHIKAEKLFTQVLKDEMKKKGEELDLFYSFSGISSDTIPLTISIMTETGSRQYKVDAGKSRKNLSQISRERSLHSVICSEKQLSPMTLSQTWADSLQTRHILARAAIQIVTTDLENNTLYKKSRTVNLSPELKFVVYLGERCEIEVSGFLYYTWWSVCRYHFFPFGMIVGIALCLIVFLIYLFRVRKHLFKTQSERWLLAEKLKRREEKLVELASIRDQYAHQIEMQRSDAREKDMLLKDLEQKSKVYEGQIAELNKAKELLGTKSLIYKLSPILTFDAYKKILVCNGEIIPLNLQSSTLLLAFLNATDCQLTREEIEKCLSGRSRECLRTAKHRLSKVLQIDPSISIVQHNRDLFQLQLPEIEAL
jgi:putative membrane protein